MVDQNTRRTCGLKSFKNTIKATIKYKYHDLYILSSETATIPNSRKIKAADDSKVGKTFYYVLGQSEVSVYFLTKYNQENMHLYLIHSVFVSLTIESIDQKPIIYF